MERYSAKSDNSSAQNLPKGHRPVTEDRCVLGSVVIERIRMPCGRINYAYHLNNPDASLSQNDIMFLEELMVLAMLGESREQRRREQENRTEGSVEQRAAYESHTKFWSMEAPFRSVKEAADKLLDVGVTTRAPAGPGLPPPGALWEKEVKPDVDGQSSSAKFLFIDEGDHLPANAEPETTFETVSGEVPGDPPPRKECKQLDLDKELLDQEAKDRATTWTGTVTLREIEDKELGQRFLDTVDVDSNDCIKQETWRDRPPLL